LAGWRGFDGVVSMAWFRSHGKAYPLGRWPPNWLLLVSAVSEAEASARDQRTAFTYK